MNNDRLRCPECRTRRTDPHAMVLHVLQCARPLCHCLGLTYPHRPMGGECHLNPEAQVRRAFEAAGPEDDPLDLFLDVALAMPGKAMKVWPYDRPAANGAFRVSKTKKISEADIEDYLHQRAKALGGSHRRVKWIGRDFAPDDRVMVPGNCFWAECKAPGADMSAPRVQSQLREHKRMRDAGETVYLFDSFEAIDAVLPLERQRLAA